MVLRDFLQSLIHNGRYNQSEIARRADISQSTVNKLLVGNSRQEPVPDTYKGICAAFSVEWVTFLGSHAEAREHLLETYGWAVPASLAARLSERTCAPASRVDTAMQHVGRALDALLSEIEQRLRLVPESRGAAGPNRVRDEPSRPEHDVLCGPRINTQC
jgi:transcriptional regulator with XRE-family HTH domain